jgi:hypothetical protein
MDVHYASTSGGPLSQANAKANSEVIFNVGAKPLLDARQVNSNLYVELDLSTITSIPGLPLTTQQQSQLAALQLLLGDKWFELPGSLIASELPSSVAAKATATQERAIGRTIVDALTTLIEKGHARSLASGGYSETGTLESVLQALEPIIASLDPSASTVGPIKGTYTLTLTDAGSVATGGSVSITAPEGSVAAGDATVTLSAEVAHDNVSVDRPSTFTVITPALIKQLLGSTSPLLSATPGSSSFVTSTQWNSPSGS